MKNLSHSASFESLDKNAPSKTGTKHLGHQASLEFEADKGAGSASSFTRGQNWIGIGPLEEQKPRSVGQWV
jgi:hypothetical protein